MSRGIKGRDIYKLKRIDRKHIIILFNNGRKLVFKAEMTDYEDCSLVSYEPVSSQYSRQK